MTPDAAELVHRLQARGLTIATAESLTAGLVSAGIADVPGSSTVLRGAVVAYDPAVKVDLLGLDADMVRDRVVSADVACALAQAARRVLKADVGIGTTGVAGPEPHGGEPVGSVWIAVALPDHVVPAHLELEGTRGSIRLETVARCLSLALEELGSEGRPR